MGNTSDELLPTGSRSQPFGLARAGCRPRHELRQLDVGDCRWRFVLTDGDTVTVRFDDRGYRNLSVAAVVERGLLHVTRR